MQTPDFGQGYSAFGGSTYGVGFGSGLGNSGFGQPGWTPFGGIDLSSVTTVTITNVATVNITATLVNIGGVSGVGGDADQGTGSSQAAQGIGRDYTRQYSSSIAARSLLEDIGLPPGLSAAAGSMWAHMAPFTPYALPAAGVYAAGHARLAAQQQTHMSMMADVGLGASAISGQFVTSGAQLSAEYQRQMVPIAGFEAATAIPRASVDFVTFGEWSTYIADRQAKMKLAPQARDLRNQIGAVWAGRDGGVSTSGLEDAIQYDRENPYGTDRVNEMYRATIGAYQSAPVSAKMGLGGSGYYAMAASGTLSRTIGREPGGRYNPALAEMQLSGIKEGLSYLSPDQQAYAMVGGTDAYDKLGVAGGLSAIASGNYSPNVQKSLLMGGMTQDQIDAAITSNASQRTSIQRGQALAETASAESQIALATGRGASVASNARAGVSDGLRMQASALRDMARSTQNPASRASLLAQAASIDAQVASNEKDRSYMPLAQNLSIAGSASSIASSNLKSVAYSGVSVLDNPGYGESIGAAESMSAAADAVVGSSWYALANPDEQASARARAAQARLGVAEARRGQSFAVYGEASSGISLTRTELAGQAAYVSMTGTPEAAFAAQSAVLNTNSDLIRNERELISRGNMTRSEINQHLETIKQLENEVRVGTEQNVRTLYASQQTLSQTRGAGFQLAAARLTMTGGSLSALGAAGAGLGEIDTQLANARERLRTMQSEGQSGQAVEDVKTQIAGLEMQRTQSVVGMAGYTPSPGLSTAAIENQTYLNIVTRTFAGQGDVRRGYQVGLGLAERRLSELQKTRDAAMRNASPEEREAIQEQYARQAAGIMNEAVGYQQALETGWQERLFSQVIGGGGNYDIVAAQFTQREASMFGGVANRYFGGNYSDSQRYRKEGSLWYSTFAHALGRPEGFLSAGASMAEGNAGHLEVGGTLRIIVQDGHGNKLVETAEHINRNNQGITATVKLNKGAMP